MDIKKKRMQVIKLTLILGVTLPILILVMSGPKSDSPLVLLLCIVAGKLTELVSHFIKNRHALFAIFIVVHIATYLFLGWIVARLIYPSKKDSLKNGVTQG
jgi:hypothetical protein